ncbi:MAG: hypothetical protein WD115_00350 [Balneolaceae bacterium]
MHKLILCTLLMIVWSGAGALQVMAQIEEPPVLSASDPKTPMDEGVRTGIGLDIMFNNYGFGVGTEFRKVLTPMKEGYVSLGITGLRDVSEQTFTDFFFGQQIVPNKFQRGITIPMLVGLRQRFFAREVGDNYRFYLSAGIGPVLAFTYPYFEDENQNGYREDLREFGISYVEPINDVFSGIGDGSWHLGAAGELKINLDMGSRFARLSSIQFGYLFYYFGEGLQMMEPNRPARRSGALPGEFPFETQPNGTGGTELVMEPANRAQSFFGTPQIRLVFSRMW